MTYFTVLKRMKIRSLVIKLRSVNRTWISSRTESDSESDSESDWGNPTQTLFEWSLCGIASSENSNFFYVIPLSGIICPIEGVLLTDRIFRKRDLWIRWTDIFLPLMDLCPLMGYNFHFVGLPRISFLPIEVIFRLSFAAEIKLSTPSWNLHFKVKPPPLCAAG